MSGSKRKIIFKHYFSLWISILRRTKKKHRKFVLLLPKCKHAKNNKKSDLQWRTTELELMSAIKNY